MVWCKQGKVRETEKPIIEKGNLSVWGQKTRGCDIVTVKHSFIQCVYTGW